MRPIKHCYNNQIANICKRVIELETLELKVMALLPEELSSICKVGSFNKGTLVITTTDAAWASQLRFLKSELRDRLRKEGGLYQLSSIDIKVIEKTTIMPIKPAKVKNLCAGQKIR